MVRLISFSLLSVVLVAFSFVLSAAERVELYTAEVAVASQQPSDRSIGFSSALKHVLIKVTGAESNLTSDEALSLLDRADSYVLTFSYRDNPQYQSPSDLADASVLESTELGGVGVVDEVVAVFPYILNVAFEERSLLRELRALALPIWGALRPSILTWAVVQNQGDRTLLSESSHESSQVLLSQAISNGLAMFLPAGDLEDQSNVNLNELWGLFPDSVAAASQRYPHELVLLARVYEAPEALELKWSLLLGREQISGRAKAAKYLELWRTMQLDIVRVLAERYAVVYDPTLDGDETTVVVSRIRSFLEYAALVDHLGLLSSVERVGVRSIQQDKVELSLKLRSSLASFDQQVELAGRLHPILVTEPVVGKEATSSALDAASSDASFAPLDSGGGLGEVSSLGSPLPQGVKYFYWRHQGE